MNLNYTQEICDNIREHELVQIEVQKYASSLQVYNKVIQAVPSFIFPLFLGPWSDIHGRKVLILCATFGYIISNAVFMLNTYFFHELRAEYLLFEALQGQERSAAARVVKSLKMQTSFQFNTHIAV